MPQKLRRVVLLVGVVESGVVLPPTGAPPAGCIRVMGAGLLLKTLEPLRVLPLSFSSFPSGVDSSAPGEHRRRQRANFESSSPICQEAGGADGPERGSYLWRPPCENKLQAQKDTEDSAGHSAPSQHHRVRGAAPPAVCRSAAGG